MLIYILLVLLIIILPIFKISKKKYCIIIGVAMTLIVGFRDINLGMNDTSLIYLPIFSELSKLSISESFNFIKNSNIEVVFYMLTRFYLIITNNYRIYLIILAMPLNFFVSRFIYKYSKIPFLSFIIFFSLNYFAMEFTLLKHCIALSILILSYDYIVKKDFKRFVLVVILAAFFHRTAIIFLIVYPLGNLKTGYKNISAIVISLFASVAIGKDILNVLILAININHYTKYINADSNTLTFFFLNLFIYLFVIIFFKKYKKENEYNRLMNIFTIGICISTFATTIGESLRMSTYFTIYSLILLPNAINVITQRVNKDIIIILLSFLLIMYFFLFTMNNNMIYPYIFGELN